MMPQKSSLPRAMNKEMISVLCQCIHLIAQQINPQNQLHALVDDFIREGISQEQQWLFHWQMFREQVLNKIGTKANSSQLLSSENNTTQQNLIQILESQGHHQVSLNTLQFENSLSCIDQPTLCNQDQSQISQIHSNLEQTVQESQSSIEFYSLPDSALHNVICEHQNADQQTYRIPNRPQHEIQQYYEFLVRLDHPATELNYLCQQTEWKLAFDYDIEFYNKYESLFYCRASVLVPAGFQNEWKYYLFEGKCLRAISKKIAKYYASLFCLFDLYRNVEGLFEWYKEIKKSKTMLKLSTSSDNWMQLFNCRSGETQVRTCLGSDIIGRYCRIPIYTYTNQIGRQIFTTLQHRSDTPIQLQCSAINNKIEPYDNIAAAISRTNEQIKQSINHYMQSVVDYKRELKNFVSQNVNTFMQPAWNLRRNGKLEVLVKHISGKQIKEYRSVGMANNRKKAEQKICRTILQNIYENHYQMYRTFKNAKDRKLLL